MSTGEQRPATKEDAVVIVDAVGRLAAQLKGSTQGLPTKTDLAAAVNAAVGGATPEIGMEIEVDVGTPTRVVTLTAPDYSSLKPSLDDPEKAAARPNLLNRIRAAVASFEGKVSKDGRNPDQGYKYATIDAITKVGRELTAEHGIVFLTVPLSRILETITFRKGGTGRRLTMRFQAVAFNTDDPADRLAWEIEVANDGFQDKGHQVCMSIARKAGLTELLQLPRGDEEDHESKSHPGMESMERGRQRAQEAKARRGEASAKVSERPKDPGALHVYNAPAEGKLEALHHVFREERRKVEQEDADLVAIPRLRDFWVFTSRETKWKKPDVMQLLSGTLGLDTSKKIPVAALAALEFFTYTYPPSILPPTSQADEAEPTAAESEDFETPTSDEGETTEPAPESEAEAIPWGTTWDALAKIYKPAADLGQPIGEAADDLKAPGGWLKDEVRAVVRSELGVELEQLPALRPGGKPFWPVVIRALSHYTPADMPEYESAEEPREPAMIEQGWVDRDRETLHGWLVMWSRLGVFQETIPPKTAKKHKMVDFVQARIDATEIVVDTGGEA